MSEEYSEDDLRDVVAPKSSKQVLLQGVNVDDISATALQALPFDNDYGSDQIETAAKYFLHDFETTARYKDKDGTRLSKQIKRYLVDIRLLIIKEIKILNIDYTHLIDFISIYQEKVQKIVEKYQFHYPMIDLDKIEVAEKKQVLGFIYLKKLLEYIEGPKVSFFVDAMRGAALELLQTEFSFDIYADPKTTKEFEELHIAVRNFPKEGNIHEITSELLNNAITIKGNLVSYDDKVRVEILKSWWYCPACQQAFSVHGSNTPQKCRNCGDKASFTEIPEKFENLDFIYVKVQQHTNSDQSQVGVTDMLVKIQGKNLIKYFYDNMKPAANLKVTGVVKLSQDKANRNNPNERLLQNHAMTIEIEGENTIMQYNEKLLDIIRHKVNPQYIEQHFEKLARSWCPHLHGQDPIKLGMLLMAVGAEPMINYESRNRVRGDMNVLLVGDSGQAKSEHGIFMMKVLPQSIRTIGGKSTTTKAALTTSVDIVNGIKVITFGVLPQCDNRGVAIVDELDKRDKDDFEVLSYCMDDNQTIPTHKSGFHHEVLARCPVLLIGNPSKKHAKWNKTKTIFEQTNFASWLISRIDLIFVMYDDGNMERKAAMVEHMSKTRTKMVIESEFDKSYKNKVYSEIAIEQVERDLVSNKFEGAYDVEYLRHEIHFLKQNYKPILKPGSSADKMLKKNYLKYSSIKTPSDFGDGDGVVFDNMMDARKYNGLERIAKAAARCRRHHTVEEEDMQTALDLMTYSIATLLPQANDDDKVNTGNPLDMIVKSLSPDRMKSTIVAEFMKKRDSVAKRLRRNYTSFNRILTIKGNRPCESCRAKGEIDDEVCLTCQGNKFFPRSFTYLDVEQAVIEANVLDSTKKCKQLFEDYLKMGVVTHDTRTTFKLPYKMESLQIQEFTERLANDTADQLMQAEAVKAFGTELPMGPTRADQIE